jgi:tetratricopeptide (TPR) repeat protein
VIPSSETPCVIPPGVAEAARHFAEGSTEQALAALQAAGAANGESVPLKFMTALLAWRLGDTALALMMSRSCFERAPENGTIAEAIASLYAQVGELRESLFYGKLAIALPPDAAMSAWFPADFPMFDKAFLSIQEKPLLSQARLLLGGGDWRAALEKARQHVVVAPHDDEGRQFYAEQLLRAGFAAAAVETLAPYLTGKAPAPAIASTLARALAAVGEAEKARQWHDHACAMAPEDAAIAATRIVDAPALGDDGEAQKRWAADWLARFTAPGKARRWRPAGERLTVGYLVAHMRRADAPALAAVASAHSRPGTTVIGYGRGAQSWDENTFFGGAFDKWRDITGFDAATLAKTLAVDGVDVVIDAAGFAAPTNIRALSRVNSAIRVAWLGAVEGLQGAIYDATLGLAPAGIERWRAPHGSYPLLRDWTREVAAVPDARCRFGSTASLAEIDARTVALWEAALAAAPEAVLLLRAEDTAHPANINRLIERVGRELAARIDIVDATLAEDFYRQVDIAFAPLAMASPSLVGEAVACGVPVLALDDGGSWCAAGDALRSLGLGELVFKDVSAYAAAAAKLARGRQARDAARAKVAAVASLGEQVAAEIAEAIEQGAKAMLGKAAA